MREEKEKVKEGLAKIESLEAAAEAKEKATVAAETVRISISKKFFVLPLQYVTEALILCLITGGLFLCRP